MYDPDEMARSMGYTGNVIMVNMTPTPGLEVGIRPSKPSSRSVRTA